MPHDTLFFLHTLIRQPLFFTAIAAAADITIRFSPPSDTLRLLITLSASLRHQPPYYADIFWLDAAIFRHYAILAVDAAASLRRHFATPAGLPHATDTISAAMLMPRCCRHDTPLITPRRLFTRRRR